MCLVAASCSLAASDAAAFAHNFVAGLVAGAPASVLVVTSQPAGCSIARTGSSTFAVVGIRTIAAAFVIVAPALKPGLQREQHSLEARGICRSDLEPALADFAHSRVHSGAGARNGRTLVP